MRHLLPVRFAALVGLCVAGPGLAAQGVDNDSGPRALYRVSMLGGYQWFDESAALRSSPLLGVRVSRVFGSFVTAGFNATMMRPESRGEFFPWNRQVYFSDATHKNDTTLLFQMNQRVTLATYGLDVGLRLGGKRGSRLMGADVAVSAGAGFWSLWLDPERTSGNNIRGGLSFPIGAGIGIPLSRGAGVGVRVDDVILTNFYRDVLSLSDPLFSEDLFRNPTFIAPPAKSTIHNVRLTVAFSFVPGTREQ